ncbi:MAG: hypothetical protein RL707_1084 [Pseudomonadota bacterium]
MRFRWVVWSALGGLIAGVPWMAQASPVLRCYFEVNAERYEQAFVPVSDPYTVGSVDLGGRFRFKAVVLGDDRRVDLINLYVSYQTQRQPMVLQHVKFITPAVQSTPAPDALTGRVALYSPFLGKELTYGCALHEVTP